MRRWHKRQYIRGAAEWALREHARGACGHRGAVRISVCCAVTRVLAVAGEDERAIYRAEYVDGMDYRRASAALHMSESTYYRRRRSLLAAVEKELEK